MKWLLDRFKEPSTHLAIALGLQGLAAVLPAYAPVLHGLSVFFGGAGFALPEKDRT